MTTSPTGRNSAGPRPGSQAYTLIEVILAVSLLAIGLVGILAAYAKSSDALRLAEDNLAAQGLLRRELAAVEIEVCEQQFIAQGVREGQFTEPYARDFAWRLDVVASPIKDLNLVTYTVTQRRTGRTYALATYLPGEPANAATPPGAKP